MSIELRFVPKDNAPNKSFIDAFSFVLTQNMPIIERMIPTAAISIGAITALNCRVTSPSAIYHIDLPPFPRHHLRYHLHCLR